MLTSQDITLEAFLRDECAAGRPGDRLPSVRTLQDQFRVSPVTVQRAVRRLVMEGRAVTRPGDGTFIARAALAVVQTPDVAWQTVVLGRAPEIPGGLDHLRVAASSTTLALDNAFPEPGLQAQELLAKAAARCAKRATAWDRCPPQGLVELRTILAAEVGAPFTAADVLVTPGAQAALDSIFRVLARPGDTAVIEDPGYPGAVVAATFAGLTTAPVPTDEHGVLPDALAEVLARTGARLVVLQPRHANPTGAVLAHDRRAQVLAVAREFACFVVEDDWVRDLDLDGPTGPPLLADDVDGHVISIRSLSKSGAPGLRVAGVIARGPVLARLTSARLAADFFVAPLLQAVAAEVLASPGWQRHLQGLRTALQLRRDTLHGALADQSPESSCVRPRGGVALWVRLPEGVDEAAIAREAAERGVRVAVGRTYCLTEPTSGHLRLAFGKDDPASLDVAAERIGAAIRAARA